MKHNTRVRQSNIELLRIIMILAVIGLHYFNGNMGGLLKYTKISNSTYYFSHVLESLFIVAVNVFVLITGYFSVNKRSIKVSKVISLCLIMIFYGITLTLIGGILDGYNILSFSFFIKIIKNSFSQWFVIIYSILYLLIPFINQLLLKLSQNELRILIVINLFFFSVWPTFFTNITDADGGYGIINFFILYLIGYYIRIYNNTTINKGIYFLVYIILTVITSGFSLVAGRAWNYNSIFVMISSVIIFMLFKTIRIPHSSLINKAASYTFMVYLIDVNSPFNLLLYRRLFHSNEYWNSNLMVINMFVSIIGIYIICLLIETVRRLLFSKIEDHLLNHINYEIKVGVNISGKL